MSVKRHIKRFAWATAVASALVLASATAATASAAPAAGGNGADTLAHTAALATPGVVLIDSKFSVGVHLRYQDPSKISGFGTVDGRYTVGDWVGTGFVVRSDGAIVTASHVVDPPMADVRHYAVNALFHNIWPRYRFPNPMSAYRITDDRALNSLLQQCYNGVACQFTVTPHITAYPATALGSQIVFPTAMPAEILKRTGVNRTDVAVLKVDGQNMPTVQLAKTALNLQAGAQLDVLGFPGSVLGTSSNGATTPTLVPVTVSSVRPGWGSGQQIQVQGGVEHGESGGPVLNSRGQVVGLVSYGVGTTDNFMRTVDDIRAALTSAGIAPAAGAVDTAYRNAMTLYWNHHYTAAVKAFRRVLDLDATNPLAQRFLASAAQRAGTKADAPLHPASTAGGSSTAFLVGKLIGMASPVLLLIGGVVAYLQRRRGQATQVTQATEIAS